MKYFKDLIKNYIDTSKISKECLNKQIKSITYNSKLVKKDYIFIAIKGTKEDGSKYIESAIEKKASIIIYDIKTDKDFIKKLKEKYSNIYFISVKNTRETLAYISAKLYDEPTKKINTIAITGTNGKTTTTYLLKSVLEKNKENKVTLIGTIKNIIGKTEIKTNLTTPESIDLENIFDKSLKKNISHIVMEASSQALAMNRCDFIHYNTVIFTNFTEDHLDYHINMQNYLKAKLKLFNILKDSSKKKKLAIINLETDKFKSILKHIDKLGNIKVVTYGLDDKADYYGKITLLNNKKTEFDFYAKGKFISKVKLSMLGKFNVLNALSVLAYCIENKMDINLTIKAMENVQVSGRFEIVTKEKHPFIVTVDYSHTPDSLENILTESKKLNPNNIIVVFGCGGDRDRKKRPIMSGIAEQYADKVIITTDNPRTESIEQIMSDIESGFKNNNYIKIIDRKEAIEKAIEIAKENDIIIIAGKGHETYQIFEDRTIDFDDRIIARESLKKVFPNI